MAKRNEGFDLVTFIFKCIWFAVACLCFFIGLVMFLTDKDLTAYVMWSMLCAVPCITDFVKTISGEIKRGKREGANTYTATVSDSGVSVSNNPLGGSFMGLVTGIIISLLLGPLVCAFKMIPALIYIISGIISMIKNKKANNK